MSGDTTITNPIEIKDNSKERVAFDLMEKISFFEHDNKEADQSKREYWLTLYRQCLKATYYQSSLKSILQED